VKSESCLFCDVQTKIKDRVVDENALAYAIRDGFPVSPGHTLLIPKRHTLDYFGLTQAETISINQLMINQKRFLESEDPTIDGFNIGMNCGETAGQSVWHCHVHLIPRRRGDVERPKGGVRHIIPNKGFYEYKK
jgi:diadenosine tetraphosphate (Ap4A) HIT family hydrolase